MPAIISAIIRHERLSDHLLILALKVKTIVLQYRKPVAVKHAMPKATRLVGPWLVSEAGKVE